MRPTRSIAAAVAALLVASAGTVGAQVVNGGFEDPVTNQPFIQISSGLTGWTIQSGSVDLVHSYWQPSGGAQSIDLSGGSAAIIYQDVLTAPGGSYDLFFAMAGNPDNGGGDRSMRVLWGEAGGPLSDLGIFSFNTLLTGATRGNMMWRNESVQGLFASAGTMRLQFESLTPGQFGVVLDDVSLVRSTSTVPEPGTVILLGTGILALGGFGLRRRAKR